MVAIVILHQANDRVCTYGDSSSVGAKVSHGFSGKQRVTSEKEQKQTSTKQRSDHLPRSAVPDQAQLLLILLSRRQ